MGWDQPGATLLPAFPVIQHEYDHGVPDILRNHKKRSHRAMNNYFIIVGQEYRQLRYLAL
jgi:hypothetical protein